MLFGGGVGCSLVLLHYLFVQKRLVCALAARAPRVHVVPLPLEHHRRDRRVDAARDAHRDGRGVVAACAVGGAVAWEEVGETVGGVAQHARDWM